MSENNKVQDENVDNNKKETNWVQIVLIVFLIIFVALFGLFLGLWLQDK